MEDIQKTLQGEELTIESIPEVLRRYLVSEAKSALNLFTFDARNTCMAKAIGLESSILAAKSIGKPEVASRLRDIFTLAASESGQTFSAFFDKNGRKLENKGAEYSKAMNATSEVALRHLPAALEAAGINVDIRSILRDVRTLIQYVVSQLPNSRKTNQTTGGYKK